MLNDRNIQAEFKACEVAQANLTETWPRGDQRYDLLRTIITYSMRYGAAIGVEGVEYDIAMGEVIQNMHAALENIEDSDDDLF